MLISCFGRGFGGGFLSYVRLFAISLRRFVVRFQLNARITTPQVQQKIAQYAKSHQHISSLAYRKKKNRQRNWHRWKSKYKTPS